MVVSGSLPASPLTISPKTDGSVVVSANGMTATLKPRIGADGTIEMAIEIKQSFPTMPPVVYRGAGDFVSPNNPHGHNVAYSNKTVAR